MNEEGKRWMAEINTFPPGAAPCLIRMDYTDTDVFSGTLTLMLKTVQGEYRICFPRTAIYLSRIEAYTSVHTEEIYTGTCIREYTKSCFLDLMKKMTFAERVEKFRHYGVYTENTVIDIASFTEPEIIKIHVKE